MKAHVATREEKAVGRTLVPRRGTSLRRAARTAPAYLAALGAVVGCTGLVAILRLPLPGAHLAILYLLPVLALASTRGRGPALATAVLGFLAYDFSFVEPVFTLTIRDPDEWLTLLVFLFTALVAGQLAAALRLRAEEARAQGRAAVLLLGQLVFAQQARAALIVTLHELTQGLIADHEPTHLLGLIAEQVVATFGVRDCAILLPDADGQLAVRVHHPPGPSSPPAARDEAATAQWAFAGAAQAGYGATLFVPLQAGTRRVGLMRVTRAGDGPLDAERRRLLSTFAAGAALAIERDLLAEATVRAAVLARSDTLKSTLLSSVSHELRTPLAAIKGSVTSLLEDEAVVTWAPAQRREFLLTIDEEADRLTRLIGNLLDLSRIEAGVLRPRREPYALDELLWGVVDRLAAPEATRVRVAVPDDLPLVPLDPVLMERVVGNLVENALKYSPPDAMVAVAVVRGGDTVRLAVTDRGAGVPPADRERIFARFFRGTRGDGVQGFGLGLAISRALVEAHGGRLWVEDGPGGGARFIAVLPLGAAPAGQDPRPDGVNPA